MVSHIVTIGKKSRATGREERGEERGCEERQKKEDVRSFLRKDTATRPIRTRFW